MIKKVKHNIVFSFLSSLTLHFIIISVYNLQTWLLFHFSKLACLYYGIIQLVYLLFFLFYLFFIFFIFCFCLQIKFFPSYCNENHNPWIRAQPLGRSLFFYLSFVHKKRIVLPIALWAIIIIISFYYYCPVVFKRNTSVFFFCCLFI